MSSIPNNPAASASRGNVIPRVLVATTALLSFISFWRAAAIVLNDLGSSAFYAGAIAEQAIGKSAPWFILAIMLFSYAVRSVYVESCSMFVRGGVYRVVKEAMGGTLAKFSVSALMFDYILTGPISGVSAGQYLTGFLNDLFHSAHWNLALPMDLTSAVFAGLVTIYFHRNGGPDGCLVRSDHLDARRPSSALDCSSQSDLFGKFARLVAPYALAVHRWDCWHSNWPGAFRPGNEWRGNPRAGLPRD
ncbi:MAG: hypothetical protein DMG40_09120 [Acidobacteria bacterium]|nr:MAG: hypothetical protein DMG40_09120 [Acidobacteriota bacterium]